jgi:hypothetical protein
MKSNVLKTVCGLFLALSLVSLGCAKLNPKFENSLNNALSAKNSDFQTCYKKALGKNPNTEGEMNLKLEFQPKSKKVEKASITDSQIKDGGMKKCVTNAAKSIETEELPGTWVDGKFVLDFSINK